jgi:hypothetical protein
MPPFQRMADAERTLWSGDHLGERRGHSAAPAIAEQGPLLAAEFWKVRKPEIAVVQRLGSYRGDLAVIYLPRLAVPGRRLLGPVAVPGSEIPARSCNA